MSDPTRPTFLERLRNWFLTGLLVLGPLVVTGYVVWKLFGFVDHLLGTTLRGGYIRPGGVPGIGFLTVLLIILVTGILASNLLGRSLGRLVEGLLLRVPYLRGLYSTLKELGEAILSEKKNALQRVVLVEYPNPGIYAIGFLTAEPRRFSEPARAPEPGHPAETEVRSGPPRPAGPPRLPGDPRPADSDGKSLAAVFIPTVPNPTTGLVLFYPEEALIPTSVTVEQAIKMVISGGVVTPERIGARAVSAASASGRSGQDGPGREPGAGREPGTGGAGGA